MPDGLKVQAAGRFHRDVLQSVPAFWLGAVEQPGHCVLDLAAVKSIDSTGLAFLAHWQRHLARGRRNLILFRPSPAVRSALAHLHLTEQFVIARGEPPEPRAAPVSVDLAPQLAGER